MGAAVGEPYVGTALHMRRAQRLLQLFRALAELHGFLLQQIAAAIDAYVAQFAGIAPQAVHLLGVLRMLAVLGGVVIGE